MFSNDPRMDRGLNFASLTTNLVLQNIYKLISSTNSFLIDNLNCLSIFIGGFFFFLSNMMKLIQVQ